jgi:hypothetical protein
MTESAFAPYSISKGQIYKIITLAPQKTVSMSEDPDAPRPSSLPPGYDDEDPYDDVDIETLPKWWQENIELFREHGLRPYRPPQFEDGRITKEVIDDLETKFDVQIQLRTVDPEHEGPWEVWVDDTAVTKISRSRVSEGRTVYSLTAKEFNNIVHNALRG